MVVCLRRYPLPNERTHNTQEVGYSTKKNNSSVRISFRSWFSLYFYSHPLNNSVLNEIENISLSSIANLSSSRRFVSFRLITFFFIPSRRSSSPQIIAHLYSKRTNENDLKTNVKFAIHNFKLKKKLKQNWKWLQKKWWNICSDNFVFTVE